jgi:hypothetical protein
MFHIMEARDVIMEERDDSLGANGTPACFHHGGEDISSEEQALLYLQIPS